MADSDSTERPFKISIPDAALDLLHKKLELVRFPDELEGAGWDYGSPLADVKRLVARWKDDFDWRKVEAEINELPMFTRDIEVDNHGTLSIHYVHKKSECANAIPLLFVHGWESNSEADRDDAMYLLVLTSNPDHTGPGHFLEVEKILSLLTASSPDYGGGGNSHGVCRTVSNATNPQGQLFAGLVTG